MNNTSKLIIFTALLALLATVCKFYFGPDINLSGFSPVLAIALFAGMTIPQRKFSFLLPLVALLVSDIVIHLLFKTGYFRYAGIYSGQWLSYLLLLSVTLIGWILKGKSIKSIVSGALAAPTAFFLLSNFSVWVMQKTMYAKTVDGLLQCYVAGLPFYRNAVLATLIFLPVIVLLYNYIMRRTTAVTLASN